MDSFTKSFGFLLVALVGLTTAQTTKGFKTPAQILTEIRSMAAGIETECVYEAQHGNCEYYKDLVDSDTTVESACSDLDLYISCQDSNCVNKTSALTQILTDAMVIPYCGEMASFPRTPDTQAFLNDVADLKKMCTLKDDHVCDYKESLLLSAGSFRKVCLYGKFYINCLKLNCQSQSYVLSKKIKEALDQPDCGLTFSPSIIGYQDEALIVKDMKELARELDTLCAYSLTSSCSYENRTVWSSYTRHSTCLAVKNFGECVKQNCLYITPYLKLALEQASTYQDCQPSPHPDRKAIEHMKKLCSYFKYGTNCDYELGVALSSTEFQEACSTLKSYALCLERDCGYVNSELQSEIWKAKTNKSCDGCALQVSILFLFLAVTLNSLTQLWR